MRIIKYLPNTLSISRIILAISLLFITALSPLFLVIYTMAGITDMIDGPIARKLNAVTPLGANLDGIADYTFTAIGIFRIVPALRPHPILVVIIVTMIVVMKGTGMIVGYIRYKQLMMMHTYGAKAGAMLAFLFPLVISITGFDVNILAVFLGLYAFLFLSEEIIINMILPEPNRDICGLREALRFRREKLTTNE
ncbi:MAG: CDP-alcohol phosphatidyltransferase family protein [Defluviitaleaceae bacterium]|nr:CDP-alcohol phosphatidyltransferase family protein [Defluviitaleaceae bacterium]